MIVDAHTHIFPPEVVKDRERFLDDEPAFNALYADPKARMVTAEGLLEAMDNGGVDISWALGFPWTKKENARLHNDYLTQVLKDNPERLRCLGCVPPKAHWALAEAERALGAGLQGIGEIAFYSGDIDVEALSPICQLCAESGCPLVLHTNEPVGHAYPGKAPMSLSALYSMVRNNPDTKLVLAHMAGGLFFYSLLKKEVRPALANVWIDTAATPYLYRPRAYGLAVELLGSDRILLGSDYPLLPVSRYKKDLASPEAGLPPQTQEMILGHAAQWLIP